MEEALAAVDKTGERAYESELYRLKGELVLESSSQSPPSTAKKSSRSNARNRKPRIQKGSESAVQSPEAEAEEDFHKAIEVARGQRAKSLELRATMSLCRLWQKQGKEEDGRQILAEVYGRFTEGLDTPDLKAARALLQGGPSQAWA